MKAILVFTPTLVRKATFAYWRRVVGIGFPIALALVGTALAYSLHQGDKSWIVGVEAAVLAFGIAFVSAIYVVHYKNGMSKLKNMGVPEATFIADNESFAIASSAGVATLKWSSVTEVWCYGEFWLLLLSKAQFFTFPLSGISAEMQAFVLESVKSAGGKVRR